MATVHKKRINGTAMVLIAGPFEQTLEEKTTLGRMIWLYMQAGTAFHIERRCRHLYLWRDVKGYSTGSAVERTSRRAETRAYAPKVWKH